MTPADRPLTIVMVADGLRPDQIDADLTPAIWSLAQEGRRIDRAYCAIPTVTRVNAASLVTGAYPARHGLYGNFLRTADGTAAVNTLEEAFVEATGVAARDLLAATTLGERFAEAGETAAVVSTISSGGSLVLNPGASDGKGVTLALRPGPSGLLGRPRDVGDAVEAMLGPAPNLQEGATAGELVDYAVDASLRFVLPTLDPAVLLCWFVEPDKSQHLHGVGSPAARAALAHLDQAIGRLVEGARRHGGDRDVTVFLLSDHGFARTIDSVDVADRLRADGIDLMGVTIVPTGLAMVWSERVSTAREIRDWADRQPWLAGCFVSERLRQDGDEHLPIDLLRCHPAQGAPDLVLAPLSVSAPNEFGVPGAHYLLDGPGGRFHSGHGSLSPYELHSTLIAAGPRIVAGAPTSIPTGIVDITPTVLAVHGLSTDGCDGRVLHELLDPAHTIPEIGTRRLRSTAHTRHDLEVTFLEVDGHEYLSAVDIV